MASLQRESYAQLASTPTSRSATHVAARTALAGSSVSSVLLTGRGHSNRTLSNASPCRQRKANPRLCRSPILGEGTGLGIQQLHRERKIPIHLNDIPELGQYPQCEEWFTILDSIFRFYN